MYRNYLLYLIIKKQKIFILPPEMTISEVNPHILETGACTYLAFKLDILKK